MIFLVFQCASVFAGKSDTLYFEWLGTDVNGVFFEKSAIIIPIQVVNDTNTYYFQLDTGANKSSIYTGRKNGVESSMALSDSLELKTQIGTIQLDTISHMSPFEEKGKLVVGTVGADILKDKVAQIDFPNQMIILSDDLNEYGLTLHEMSLSYGRPVFHLPMAKSNYQFLFDTGSSIFELWTTRKIWKKATQRNSPISEFSVWSWGKLNLMYTASISGEMNFLACENIELNSASYSANKKHRRNFKQAGVDGVIGNKPFLENVVVLNFKSMQIGVQNCP